MNNEFFVTLISNASMNLFPHNTQARFITKLNPPISLSGKWSIGLSEISVPRSLYNITLSNNKYDIFIWNVKENIDVNYIRIYLPKEINGNFDFLVEQLNKSINREFKSYPVKFKMIDDESMELEIFDSNYKIEILRNEAPEFSKLLNLSEITDHVYYSTDATWDLDKK